MTLTVQLSVRGPACTVTESHDMARLLLAVPLKFAILPKSSQFHMIVKDYPLGLLFVLKNLQCFAPVEILTNTLKNSVSTLSTR